MIQIWLGWTVAVASVLAISGGLALLSESHTVKGQIFGCGLLLVGIPPLITLLWSAAGGR